MTLFILCVLLIPFTLSLLFIILGYAGLIADTVEFVREAGVYRVVLTHVGTIILLLILTHFTTNLLAAITIQLQLN
jgi:hypothetical protein